MHELPPLAHGTSVAILLVTLARASLILATPVNKIVNVWAGLKIGVIIYPSVPVATKTFAGLTA